ncbi:hypothetical protein PALB_34780 [Pseudoalteromonas luteoviolacea B = ATCC 29581]|nr:hypothetical protein PALB_34780 [Pseudoalteromonas luteoviolacea B = ATCC 29581]
MTTSLGRTPYIFAFLFTLLLFLNGCGERVDKQYDRLEQAYDLTEKGWLPTWLPKDTFDLKVHYELDSNQVFLRLRTRENLEWMPKECLLSEFIDQLPASLPSWWPLNANRFSSLKKHYQIYLCKDEGLWWIAQPEQASFVLIWHQADKTQL